MSLSTMNLEKIKNEIASSVAVKEKLLANKSLLNDVLELSKSCADTLKTGGKIMFCGNGGSFADAQHLSAEFTSRFMFDRPGLPSLALGTNSSAMTAIGNDYGYDTVFSREIQAIGAQEDILIAITTSGNSSNIILAIEEAQKQKIPAVVLTGSGMGKLSKDTRTVNVPSSDTARIQECHILIGHIVCNLVEEEIFSDFKK